MDITKEVAAVISYAFRLARHKLLPHLARVTWATCQLRKFKFFLHRGPRTRLRTRFQKSSKRP